MKLVLTVLSAIFILGLSSSANAQQGELDLQHPDQILESAYPGRTNVVEIQQSEIPQVVTATLSEIDIPFEMADGYYDSFETSYFRVVDGAGNAVGYIQQEKMTYTEDPVIVVAIVKVNSRGLRLGIEPEETDRYARDEEEEQ